MSTYQIVVVGGPRVEVLVVAEIFPMFCIDVAPDLFQMVVGDGIQIYKVQMRPDWVDRATEA